MAASDDKGSIKFSYPQLERVYEQACGVAGQNCNGEPAKWNDLEVAANTLYGASNQKAVRFRNAGASHGVDF